MLIDRYGIGMEARERIVMSDQNALAWTATDQGHLVVKWGVDPDRFARLEGLARLTAWLGERGVPVSRPVPALDGCPQVRRGQVSVGVQRVIGGHLLDAASATQVGQAGADLATLHQHVAQYPTTRQLQGLIPPKQSMRTQIEGWLDTAPSHQPPVAVERLRRLIQAAPDDELPVQLLHGDYRSANILYGHRRITGILDFEEARLHHAITELAQSAVLSGTKFHNWGPVSPQIRDCFVSVRDLNAKIRAFITGWNDRRHPFVWTKTAEQVLKKANRKETSHAGH